MENTAGRFGYKLAAIALVLAVTGLVVLAVALFDQAFTDRVPVTVHTQRAGLVMEPGARVKMAGVTVGTVESIDPAPGGAATLALALDSSALESIPANVTVQITSNTVFGAKYVSLVTPPAPAAERLAPGAVIDESAVTVEVNTVFENLTQVLRTVRPEKLDATLGALASALQGRGDDLGTALERADTSLTEFLDATPELRRVLTDLPAVTGTYDEAAPDLMRTLSSLTPVGVTVAEQRENLDLLLLNVTGLANTGADVLGRNADKTVDLLSLAAPSTSLLHEYSPAIPCMFRGLEESKAIGDAAYNAQPGLKMSISLVPGTEPYHYPDDLPKVAASGGPHCMGLPLRDPDVPAPFLVTDTGVNPFAPERSPNGGVPVTGTDLLSYLFGVTR